VRLRAGRRPPTSVTASATGHNSPPLHDHEFHDRIAVSGARRRDRPPSVAIDSLTERPPAAPSYTSAFPRFGGRLVDTACARAPGNRPDGAARSASTCWRSHQSEALRVRNVTPTTRPRGFPRSAACPGLCPPDARLLRRVRSRALRQRYCIERKKRAPREPRWSSSTHRRRGVPFDRRTTPWRPHVCGHAVTTTTCRRQGHLRRHAKET